MGHLLCLLGRRGSRLSTLVGHTCRSRCAGACRGASGQRCARYLYLYLSPVRTLAYLSLHRAVHLHTYHLGTPPRLFLLISQAGAYRPGLVTHRCASLAAVACHCDSEVRLRASRAVSVPSTPNPRPPRPYLWHLWPGSNASHRAIEGGTYVPHPRAPATLAVPLNHLNPPSSKNSNSSRMRTSPTPLPPKPRNETKRNEAQTLSSIIRLRIRSSQFSHSTPNSNSET